MALKEWAGRASKVTQVTKVVFSVITAGQTYTVTINGKSVSYTATTGVLLDLLNGLIGAWSSSAEPEHQEHIASSDVGPTGLILTAATSGVPHVVTASATTGIATVTYPTVASGPNFWNVAANWSGGTLPVAADDIVLRDSSVSILYGLVDTLNYTSIKREASYTGQIGLPKTNELGYPEYRTRSLTLGTGSAIIVELGYGVGSHAVAEYYDFQGSNVTLSLFGSTQNISNGYPVNIIGTGAGSTVNVYGGSVSFDSASTSTIATLNVIERSQSSTQSVTKPYVRISNLVTTTTITALGGEMLIEGAFTTLSTRDGARVTVAKASAGANVNVGKNAILGWNTSGGITTKLTVESAGKIDFGQVGTTKTVALAWIYSGGEIADPLGKVTWTGGIVLQACRIADVIVDKGFGVTI